MKKIIVCLLFAGSMYVTTPGQANAIVCSNCSQIVTQLIEYALQGMEYAKETVAASQSTITAYQQTLETVNNTILIPMRDAAALMVLMSSGDNLQNLILGSMGVDPLLIKNPEQYFKNTALNSLGVSYSQVAAYKDLFGGSLLTALVNNSRYSYMDHSAKLQTISQSQIPSIIQKNACTDEKLNQLAREDVMASNQQNDEMAFQARKAYFYNTFCVGNPSNDPETAQALQALQKARPDIGGWDSWLALTSGDNQYRKYTDLQLEIEAKARQAVETAKNDYNLGGGIKSLTECKKYAENDINGNLYGETSTAPCELQEIKQVSSVLASTYKEVVETPMKLIRESFGTGAGSLIGTAFNTLNIINGISSSLNQMSGSGSSSGGGGGRTSSPTWMNNTGTQTTSTSRPVQNLAGNPQAKSTITDPALKQLQSHLTGISTLRTTDQNYLGQVNLYQSRLNSMKACFDQLEGDFNRRNDSRIAAALDFYDRETSTNTTLRNTLTAELAKVDTATSLINNTIASINASQSSQEIQSIFTTYTNTVESQNLPNSVTSATRDGEYIIFSGKVDQSNKENGDIYKYKQDCAQIQSEMQNYGNQAY